jgi:hypothetical protein
MGRRTLRWSVVVVLLGVAVGTGLFARKQGERMRSAEAELEEVSGRLDQHVSLVRGISDAQLRYLTLGLGDSTATAANEPAAALAANVQALRGRMHAPGAEARLTALASASQTVATVDARARENVRAGEVLMAADLVLTEARDAATSVETEAGALRTAELFTLREQRRRMLEAAVVAIGGAAGIWLIGVLLLVRVPRAASHNPPLPSREAEPAVLPVLPPAPAAIEPPAPPAATIDLPAVAALCTDIARASTTMALTELLSRASSVLGAPGMIVWMASGDELFAALGVGYDPLIVARLGTIHADAENATATAWRTGEMQTVQGDMVSRGAIVCPLFGAEGCVGVLAVEVPNGRDADPATRAITTLIGAQLATILAGWPTAQPQQPDTTGLIDNGGALAAPMRVEA